MTAEALQAVERRDRRETLALAALAAVFALAGAIALALGLTLPHGPIVVAIGMHVPLLLALWIATGLARGASGADMGPSLRIVWCVLLDVAICAGAMLILGVAELLTRPLAFAALTGAGLIVMTCVLLRRSGRSDQPNHRARISWIWCPLCVIGAVVATFALLNPQYDFDMLYYHLFVPAQWMQEGRVYLVPIHFGEFAPTYYPYAAELYYLSLMLPMGNDHLARGGQLLFFIELMAVVAALGRELRMKPAARVATVSCVVLIPAFAWQAATANVDLALSAHLAAVALFSIRLARRPRTLDIAGLILAMGLAIGTKMLAFPYLLALSPLWGRGLYCIVRQARGWTRVRLSNAAAVFAVLLAAGWIGGYWYGRNWLVTGNPLYPLRVAIGDTTLFEGVFDRAAMLNSSFNMSRFGLEGLNEIMADVLRMPYWFAATMQVDSTKASTFGARSILGAVLVTTVLSLTSRRFRKPYALPAMQVSVIAMLALFWWSVPYQIPRFLWPPIVLSIVAVIGVVSRLPARAARWTLLAIGAAWLVVCVGVLSSTFLTVAGVAAGIGALLLFAAHARSIRFASVATFLVAIIAVWWALWFIDRGGDAPRRAVYEQARLRGFGDAWAWLDDHVSGRTIAYAGHNIPYFLMGPRLRNRVIHVLAGGQLDWAYHNFAASPAARSLGRPNVTDFAAPRIDMNGNTWLRRLADEHVDYVVVSRLFQGTLISHRHDRDAFPIERQWLDTLATSHDAYGRSLASRTIFGGGWLLFYRLNLPSDESLWPQLSTVVQTETDALDRRRRDGTPGGAMIEDYPLAAQAIESMKLDALPKQP